MNTWIKNNISTVITITLLLVSIIGNWAINQTRLDQIEKTVAEHTIAIETQRENGVAFQVALARIQTDLEYIKAAVTDNKR